MTKSPDRQNAPNQAQAVNVLEQALDLVNKGAKLANMTAQDDITQDAFDAIEQAQVLIKQAQTALEPYQDSDDTVLLEQALDYLDGFGDSGDGLQGELASEWLEFALVRFGRLTITRPLNQDHWQPRPVNPAWHWQNDSDRPQKHLPQSVLESCLYNVATAQDALATAYTALEQDAPNIEHKLVIASKMVATLRYHGLPDSAQAHIEHALDLLDSALAEDAQDALATVATAQARLATAQSVLEQDAQASTPQDAIEHGMKAYALATALDALATAQDAIEQDRLDLGYKAHTAYLAFVSLRGFYSALDHQDALDHIEQNLEALEHHLDLMTQNEMLSHIKQARDTLLTIKQAQDAQSDV